MVHMPEGVLLAPLHGLDDHHGELGKHGLHLLFGVHGVAFHFKERPRKKGTTEGRKEPRNTRNPRKRRTENSIRKNKLNYVMNA